MKKLEEIELEQKRALYLAQLQRRETVRASIAVPLASLSFAAFGLGFVARDYEFIGTTIGLQIASFAAAFAACLAAIFLLVAISYLLRLDFSQTSDWHRRLDLQDVQARNAQLLQRVAKIPPTAANRQGIRLALSGATDEFWRLARQLEGKSRRNLELQRISFLFLLLGVFFLILAIFLTGFTKAIDQSLAM